MLKQTCFDRFVGLSWLALAAASGGCGSQTGPDDNGAGDAGPALRGRVSGGLGGDTDAGSDAKSVFDGSPVIDATVPPDMRATDVPPAPADSGPPDLGPPDVPPRVCVPGSSRCVAGEVQTCDASGAWRTTGAATQELLVNPAFDLDPLETGWTNPGNPIVFQALAPGGGGTNRPDIAARSLPNLSWFGGYQGADDRLSQSIAIPAGAIQLTFSLFYAVVTGKTGVTEIDTFDATLVAGTQVISLAHLSNLDATETWTPVSVSLPATLAGQTVTLQLRAVNNNNVNRFTSFYLDTMSLQATACGI